MTTHTRPVAALLATSALSATILLTSAAPASAEPAEVVLYEGNGGSTDIVDVFDDTAGQFVKPRQNDEARSVVLHRVRAGAVITVYDDGAGKKTDDYCIITVRKSHPEYVVRTFERTYDDEFVDVIYVRRNGLDGKVSRVRVQ